MAAEPPRRACVAIFFHRKRRAIFMALDHLFEVDWLCYAGAKPLYDILVLEIPTAVSQHQTMIYIQSYRMEQTLAEAISWYMVEIN
jgi:hypothetical protein